MNPRFAGIATGVALLALFFVAAPAHAQQWQTAQVDISTAPFADAREGYRGNLDARWTVDIPGAARIRIVFTNFDLEEPWDYLYVVPGLHPGAQGPWRDAPYVLRLTGNQGQNFVSRELDGAQFTFYLHTDFNNAQRHEGFRVARIEWIPARPEGIPGLALHINNPGRMEGGTSFQFVVHADVAQEGARKPFPIEQWDPAWEAQTADGRRVLTISSTGLFQAPTDYVGPAIVRARYQGAQDEQRFDIYAPPPRVVGLAIQPPLVDLELAGGRAECDFQVVCRMSDGATRPVQAREATWAVEPQGATINAGHFVATAAGAYAVSATYQGQRATACANVYEPAPVSTGGGGNRVVVAMTEEDGGVIISDALEQAGFTIVGRQAIQAYLAGAPLSRLFTDRAFAQRIASQLNARGEANILVTGRVNITVRPFNRTYNTQTILADFDVVCINGANMVELTRVQEQGVGTATREDRARGDAIQQGAETVGQRLAEELPLSAARPEVQESTVEIHVMGIGANDQATSGRLFRALLGEIQGLRLSGVRYDAAQQRLTAVCHFPGRADELDSAIRSAVDTARVGEEFTLTEVTAERITFRYQSRITGITIRVTQLASDRYRRDGDAFYAMVSGLPGVTDVERRYDEASQTLTLIVRYEGRTTDLDDRLWRMGGGTGLGGLAPVTLDAQTITYRVIATDQPISILVRNVDAQDLRVRGEALTRLFQGLPGVTGLDRNYDESSNRLRFTLRYAGRPFELDRLIWAAARDVPDLRGLTVAPSEDATLAYELPAIHPRRIVIRLTNIDPDAHRDCGVPFRLAVADLPGVAGVEESYNRDQATIELRIDYSGEPPDLDRSIWEDVIRQDQRFARLAPGDSHQNEISYIYRAAQGPVAYRIRVSNLNPASYATDGRGLLDVIRALQGVTEIQPSYDPQTQMLVVTCRYAGRPYELEDAIFTAVATRTFSAALAPEDLEGNEIGFTFLVKQGEESRVVARLEGLAANQQQSIGQRFAAAVSGVAGVRSAEPAYDASQRILDVSLWFDGYPQDLFDAVVQAVTRDSALAQVQALGISGSTIRFGVAAGAQPPSRTGVGQTSVSTIVSRALPSVVMVRTSLASDPNRTWIGSGFFVNHRGYVLTSYALIAPRADGQAAQSQPSQCRIEVQTVDGRSFVARFVGGDAASGLALIRIPGEGYPTLDLGDESALAAGSPVILLGNQSGLARSVSVGAVSGVDAQGRIQTDAVIHDGNAGGPALDAQGRVIGVVVSASLRERRYGRENVAAAPQTQGFIVGIGRARSLLDQVGRQ